MKLPLLSRSPLESKRFGWQIHRGRLIGSTDQQFHQLIPVVFRELFANRIDVAIVRIPTGESGIESLAESGLSLIHADTLVYYRCPLAELHLGPLPQEGLVIRMAKPGDLDGVRSVIASSFAGYRNHYQANPLFSEPDIIAGYTEWSERHAEDPNSEIWVVESHGETIAFAVAANHDAGVCEIVLNGVVPRAAGRGVYGTLLSHIQHVHKAAGRRELLISTQVGNFGVQKVWVRSGFHMFEAWDTWHICALVDALHVADRRPIVRENDPRHVIHMVEVGLDAGEPVAIAEVQAPGLTRVVGLFDRDSRLVAYGRAMNSHYKLVV